MPEKKHKSKNKQTKEIIRKNKKERKKEKRCIERGSFTAVQFILFNFANYSPSISMELKVNKEIYMEMSKSEIRDKQICLLSISFEAANSRDQL